MQPGRLGRRAQCDRTGTTAKLTSKQPPKRLRRAQQPKRDAARQQAERDTNDALTHGPITPRRETQDKAPRTKHRMDSEAGPSGRRTLRRRQQPGQGMNGAENLRTIRPAAPRPRKTAPRIHAHAYHRDNSRAKGATTERQETKTRGAGRAGSLKHQGTPTETLGGALGQGRAELTRRDAGLTASAKTRPDKRDVWASRRNRRTRCAPHAPDWRSRRPTRRTGPEPERAMNRAGRSRAGGPRVPCTVSIAAATRGGTRRARPAGHTPRVGADPGKHKAK